MKLATTHLFQSAIFQFWLLFTGTRKWPGCREHAANQPFLERGILLREKGAQFGAYAGWQEACVRARAVESHVLSGIIRDRESHAKAQSRAGRDHHAIAV